MNSPRTWNPGAIAAPLFIAALAILALASPDLTAAWELNRTHLAAGQWWRLVTAHLTHWNHDHLFWDAASFVALGVYCMRRHAARTLACVFASAVTISLAVLAFHPDLDTYRGLSGLDTALFTLAAMLLWRDARRDHDRALAAVAKWSLGALVAKTAYELTTGATLFVNSPAAGFIPLASAHAVGAAIGILAAVIPGRIRHQTPQRQRERLVTSS